MGTLQIKFSTFFLVLALFISIICGFIAENRIPHIVFVSIIGGLIFAGLGFGIYMVFEQKVPEMLEFLGSISYPSLSQFRGEGEGEGGMRAAGEGNSEFKLSSKNSSDDFGANTAAPLKSGKFGDHIVVDNITIKNEPKLMAEAIRTIMAQDEPDIKQPVQEQEQRPTRRK